MLFGGNVFVDVLAAPESIEEDVGEAGNDNPVAAHIAYTVSNIILYERQDAATADQCHEDAAGHGCVFAQAFGGEVENGSPHNGGAETTEGGKGNLQGHFGTVEVDGGRGGDEDEAEQEEDSYGGRGGEHGFGGDLAAQQATDESSAKHQEPVGSDEPACKVGTKSQSAILCLEPSPFSSM